MNKILCPLCKMTNRETPLFWHKVFKRKDCCHTWPEIAYYFAKELYEMKEGENCPKCKKGLMVPGEVENCSCHINPPCSACVDNPMVCDECGYEEED